MVQKASRKNVTSGVLMFSSFLSFGWASWVEKLQSTQKTALKQNKIKHVHFRKEVEAQ